jgi:hypothetical protein
VAARVGDRSIAAGGRASWGFDAGGVDGRELSCQVLASRETTNPIRRRKIFVIVIVDLRMRQAAALHYLEYALRGDLLRNSITREGKI